MTYIIGSGYHYNSAWDWNFYNIWRANTEKYSTNYYVISTAAAVPAPNLILCNHNLGHVHKLVNEQIAGLCGWSASVCALAMIAYNCGKDFIFKESDCLWFGAVPEQLYSDIGPCGMVFGATMTSEPFMPCAQATFLIKHDFILDFLRGYLSLPHDKDMLPEEKFVKVEEQYPGRCTRMSFGVDRMRPIPWDAAVWYAQHWTPEELEEAKVRKLLDNV